METRCALLLLAALVVATASASGRPYGPNAPWNIPATGIPLHPESAHYCDLLWSGATADRPGNFNLTFDDYTYPVYVASHATGDFPVRTKWKTNLHGKTMPWNPDWRPPPGSDAQVIVLDPSTGREWNLWQVRFDGKTIHATNGNLVQAGEEAGDGSDPGDYRTKENGFRPSRGIGIQYLAMLVRPWEIREGVIRHALSMPIKNPDGTFFVPPATKLENYQNRSQPGIPEGMRFSLAVSDAEIDAWLSALPEELPEETRRAARIIAVALRDYGWFITDTSGGAHFQFEARMTAAKEWEALGLAPLGTIKWKQYPRDLLDGLITRERLHAHVTSDRYPKLTDANAPAAAPSP